MYQISKEFHFSASHQLTKVPDWHPCARLHGHNYVVILALSSEELNDMDFVRDYGVLDKFKRWLDDTIDHRDLNEVLHPMETTAENMARYFYDKWKHVFPELFSVSIKETPKTSAIYYA